MDQTFAISGNQNDERTQSETSWSFNEHTEDRRDSEGSSPDFAGRDLKASLYNFFRRRCSEKDSCSLSSGEMLRSNILCQEEQSWAVVSSLEEPHISPAASQLSSLAKVHLPSTTLPVAIRSSTKRVSEENTGHPCLGVTFTLGDSLELLPEEMDIVSSDSVGVLNEGHLWKTFTCEPSLGLTNEANAGAESLLQISEFTPDHGKTVCSMSAIQEGVVHTSTPVQNVGNRMPPLLSSPPLTEDLSRLELQLLKKQPMSVTPKQRLGTLPTPSRSNVKKTQRFHTSDLSGAKPKVLTKSSHQTASPGPSQHKPKQSNVSDKPSEGTNKTSIRITPGKLTSRAPSSTSKMFHAFHGKGHGSAANLKVKQSYGLTVEDGHVKARASSFDPYQAVNDPASPLQSAEGSFEKNWEASSQMSATSAEHAGRRIPARSGQMDPKVTPQKSVSNKTRVKFQDKPPENKTRPRCSSDSSTLKRLKEKRATLRVATSFILPKIGNDKGLTNSENLKHTSQNKPAGQTTNSQRDVKKISLVAENNKSATAEALLDESMSRSQILPSSRQTPAASPGPNPVSSRQRRGACERADVFRIDPGTKWKPQIQLKNNADCQRTQETEEMSHGIKPQLNGTRPPQTPTRPSLMGPPLTPASRIPRKTPGLSRGPNEGSDYSELCQSTWRKPDCQRTQETEEMSHGIKPHLNGTRPPQTPTRPSLMGPPLTPTSRIPRKTPGLSRGPNECSDYNELCRSTRRKPGSAHEPTTIKSVVLKARLVSTPGKIIESVDQNKSKASSCKQKPQQQPPQPPDSFGSQNVVLTSFPQDEKKEQNIKQLKQLLAESNHRFQGIVIVIQQVLDQHDKASKKCMAVSEELVKLRGKLESVEEKDELRAALHDATQSLQDQHKEDVAELQPKPQEQHLKDVAELEQSLLARYQAEWDKLHLTFQQEADSCREFLQKQMTELKAYPKIPKLELNQQHEQQHEQKHEVEKWTWQRAEFLTGCRTELLPAEVRRVHGEELQCFSQRAETSLCKDSYTHYLEQELESLKVVLDLKTKQLCQHERNLMEISELRERNGMLEENIKKVQQKNEDLTVRVEKHTALSRQLSTEHAILQESLHKESKVIERLTLENEELLWKLQNGVS